jgi:hypothetical protein
LGVPHAVAPTLLGGNLFQSLGSEVVVPSYRFDSTLPSVQRSCACIREFKDDQEAISWARKNCEGQLDGQWSVWQGERLVFSSAAIAFEENAAAHGFTTVS